MGWGRGTWLQAKVGFTAMTLLTPVLTRWAHHPGCVIHRSRARLIWRVPTGAGVYIRSRIGILV